MSWFDDNREDIKEVYYKRAMKRSHEGWHKKDVHKSVELVQVKYVSPKQTLESQIDPLFEKQIREHLAESLAQELVKKNLVQFNKDTILEKEADVYIARLKVVRKDNNNSNVITQENAFYMNSKEYTEDMIKEAIKNTFPEDFI